MVCVFLLKTTPNTTPNTIPIPFLSDSRSIQIKLYNSALFSLNTTNRTNSNKGFRACLH